MCCLSQTVTIQIVNDESAKEVIFRFVSDTVSRECVYRDTFGPGDFVYGIMPDMANGQKDDFYIYNITVTSLELYVFWKY